MQTPYALLMKRNFRQIKDAIESRSNYEKRPLFIDLERGGFKKRDLFNAKLLKRSS
jgi:hypothetical protein